MSGNRCPSCHLPLTSEERKSGRCPSCHSALESSSRQEEAAWHADKDTSRFQRERRPRTPAKGKRWIKIVSGIIGAILVVVCTGIGYQFGARFGQDAVAWLSRPGEGKQAVEFNDYLVKKNKELAKQGRQLGLALQPALMGQPINQQEWNTRLQGIRKLLHTIKADLQTIKVPSKKSARDLQEEYKRFLKTEEEGISELDKIIDVVQNPSLSQLQKKSQIESMIKSFDRKEKQALKSLQEAQRKFAKDYNIRIIDLPTFPVTIN